MLKLRAEANHEKGRQGVFDTKLWLESTTHVALGYNAYNFTRLCTVDLFDDKRQTFDLFGKFLARNVELYVEVKTYDAVGGQAAAFQEFLAIAYCATARALERGYDFKAEFMWVTTHPFAQGNWSKLTTREEMEAALNDKGAYFLNGRSIDPAILTAVSERTWLIMLNKRQHELALDEQELASVATVIERMRD